jgi:LPS export ABC transporter protein LptC
MNRALDRRTSRLSGALTSAALGILLLLVTTGCSERRTDGLPPGTADLPDQEVRDFALTETDQGAVEWKLYAGYAAMYDVKNTITARGVCVDFYDEKGVQSSQLTAREGEINQLTRDMTARGNVVLTNSDGTRMSTQSIRFLNRQQKIVSDVQVRVEKNGNVLTGIGFESDPDLKHYEFKHDIHGTVSPGSEKLIGPREGKK